MSIELSDRERGQLHDIFNVVWGTGIIRSREMALDFEKLRAKLLGKGILEIAEAPKLAAPGNPNA